MLPDGEPGPARVVSTAHLRPAAPTPHYPLALCCINPRLLRASTRFVSQFLLASLYFALSNRAICSLPVQRIAYFALYRNRLFCNQHSSLCVLLRSEGNDAAQSDSLHSEPWSGQSAKESPGRRFSWQAPTPGWGFRSSEQSSRTPSLFNSSPDHRLRAPDTVPLPSRLVGH